MWLTVDFWIFLINFCDYEHKLSKFQISERTEVKLMERKKQTGKGKYNLTT